MSHPNFQAPSPEDLAELLPQYDIEFFIAQGGMGAVYKGRQISLDRDIAIKVLPVEVGQNKEFRESFITEAKAMARLNHPNLLGVFDYGDVEGMPYIVMEFVDGESLHDAAWNQAIESSQAVAIVKGICDGLAHAHTNGIIHRDIKPSNILLTTSIEAKVADFGLAKATDSDTPGLDMGTPGYTAPEVFQDPNAGGPLADIYAVGVILHQLLSGIDPAGSMEPPTEPTGNLILDKIWRKATNVNPSLRYPTVAAMGAELDKWINAKNNAPVRSARPAPMKSYRPPAQMHTSAGGGGGGVKIVAAVVVLVIAVLFYQQRQKGDDRGKGKNTGGASVKSQVSNPILVPNSDPDPIHDSYSKPDTSFTVESINPFDEPDLDPDKVGDSENPFNEPDIEPDPEPQIIGELPPGDPELRELAVGLIVDARKKRDKELVDNVRALLFSMNTDSREAGNDELKLIDELKDHLQDGRIPTISVTAILPTKVVSSFERALSKEASIDASHQSDLIRIRDAYVARLMGAAKESSDEDLKKCLLAQAGRANDLDSWVTLLAPGPKVERSDVKNSGGGSPLVVGNWDNFSYKKSSRWIAHPDGRMEIVGEDWDVTWELLDDGALIVEWGKKAPYRYTRDGDNWVGTNPHGGEASLTRGDW